MGSAPELSIRLRDLATDRQRLARMGAQALKRFARHPTWEQSMTTVREFLLETVRKLMPGPESYNTVRYLKAKAAVDDNALNGLFMTRWHRASTAWGVHL